jgi:predicted ATP-dependent Lon-type protease
VQAQVDLRGLTGRNQHAVVKTASGLLKLVYPHRTADDLEHEELALCLDLAVECRERVIHQLAIMAPEEFKPLRFELL